MKILHVTKKYPNALGGDAVVVSNLEKQQVARGHKVTILTSNCDEIKNNKNVYKFGLKDTPAALDNITPKRLISLMMLFFKAYKVFKIERPDVIHTHSIDMAFFISFAARHYHIPIVHTFHTVTFNAPHQSVLRRKTELLLLRGTKPRKIFILNPADIQDFNKAGFSNAVYIPNGINVEDWETKNQSKKNGKFTFIAVGRLEEEKGLKYLIEAAAKLRESRNDFQVQIIGGGSLHDNLEKQINNFNLNDTVFLLGRRSPKELKILYAKANVFVLSSLWEEMPLTLLEAWAAGLPTIATKVGSIPHIAQNISILITPANSMELSSIMDKIANDSGLQKRLVKASNNVLADYSWININNTVTSEYKNVTQKQIVQVSAYYPPHIGGVEKVVESLANAQRKKGFEVCVITTNQGMKKGCAYEDSLPVYRLKSFEVAHTPIPLGLIKQMYSINNDSIIHIHAAQVIIPELAFTAAKLRKLPIVIHVHADVGPSGLFGKLLPIYKKIILGFMLRHSDHIVVLNKTYKNIFIEKYHLKSDHISIVPNGVDDRFFNNTDKPSHNGPTKILFVGRLSTEKNIPMIIDAVRKTKVPIQLDIVGDGPLLAALKRQIRNIKNQKIVFHGRKTSEELIKFYRNTDALIIASDYEGQPTVIMEAMASGTPVIGVNVIGIKETIGKDGILVDKNVKELAQAITKISSDPTLRAELANKARIRAKTFAWAPSLIKIEKIYSKL
jgi:glycosyltransferase involved in cell wall biosynthesis